ncbi:MAG TPA: hypothetical protein DEG69_06885 [Flavobacteriaceae bacterium]|nr:hypothetical protein [Flavobacteriaceae bacterium]|tara:strand:+ start:162 stop:623 length:462 start_codon:yes stop_codon:yes gene_type:complete
MKRILEVDFLDEWIFPESEDPLVDLSVKISEALVSKVKKFNKINPKKRVNINQLKSAFVAGADDPSLKDSDLIQAGFDRVNEFLVGKLRSFRKDDFEIRSKSDSSFEIAYAKIEKETKTHEVETLNLTDYQVSSIDELYIEDYRRSQIALCDI